MSVRRVPKAAVATHQLKLYAATIRERPLRDPAMLASVFGAPDELEKISREGLFYSVSKTEIPTPVAAILNEEIERAKSDLSLEAFGDNPRDVEVNYFRVKAGKTATYAALVHSDIEQRFVAVLGNEASSF